MAKPTEAEEADAEESEYELEATPGPGSYEFQPHSKKGFRSQKEKFQKIFISPLQRFHPSPVKYQEVTYVNGPNDPSPNSPNSRKPACTSFLSKSPKFAAPPQTDIPPPGYYDTRQTLEHDLVRRIVRSSNTNTFISRQPREAKRKEELPGPGCYEVDRSGERLGEERDTLSYAYKSQLGRNLECGGKAERARETCELLEMSKNEKQAAIHVKEDNVVEDVYCVDPPPFFSGTERFPTPKPTALAPPPAKLASPILPQPHRLPFNSSSRRELPASAGEGVGVGLYGVGTGWAKRSFNVLFN